MKFKIFILFLLLSVASVSAKDVITKTDGTKLDAKVEKITDSYVEYRKASNPTGPIYTIALESVATIQYENGDVDKFNEVFSNETVAPVTTNGLSDDDLIKMSGEQDKETSSSKISDVQLIQMANGKTLYEDYIEKVHKYKKIAWIGSGVLLIVGVGISMAVWGDSSNFIDSGGIAILGSTFGAAAAWCICFNLKANSLMKEARRMQSYSTTLIENDIFKFGDNSLTAGINLMGNRMVNSHSLGLSLGLNF